MIKKLFSVYDKKAEAYLQPIMANTIGEVKRQFMDIVNDGKSPFGKHPEDFELYHIGEWDDNTGRYKQSLVQETNKETGEVSTKVINTLIEKAIDVLEK